MIEHRFPPLPFRLPRWAARLMQQMDHPLRSEEDRMRFVVNLALRNIMEHTGGPFAAAIFEAQTGRLISVGVNLVVLTNCSLAHAELVALVHAHHTVRHFNLGAPGMPEHELVTSSEPCAMCFGAIPWSGVRRVLCGARTGDAEAIGFDEGPKPRRWVAALEQRGITVVRDLCRREAVSVLLRYQQSGGIIYNASRDS